MGCGIPQQEYNAAEQKELLHIARSSIQYGLERGKDGFRPDMAKLPPSLGQKRASFVTLLKEGALRGCIGTLEARRTLAQDVASNAYQSAFHDTRFEPLRQEELNLLKIEISVLSPMKEIQIATQDDLLAQLQPRMGLTIQDGSYSATFLPSVWEQLPQKEEFLTHLKRKAGMKSDHWSPQMRAWLYSAYKIGDS